MKEDPKDRKTGVIWCDSSHLGLVKFIWKCHHL